MRGTGLGLLNAPLMSAAINAVRREQTSIASSLLTIIMQVGGAFGVALSGATLERRQYYHYAHYLQQINDAFSPAVYQAQSAMQQLLLKAGYSPAEVLVKGKNLMALWIKRQAGVAAFGDTFVFLALIIALGIVPALLIRNRRAPEGTKPAAMVG
jgi:DHA2 family multidrug resistance protein